jgi:hypothetical protein
VEDRLSFFFAKFIIILKRLNLAVFEWCNHGDVTHDGFELLEIMSYGLISRTSGLAPHF